MGRKRTGKWKHVSFFFACSLIFIFGVCGCKGLLRTQSHGDWLGRHAGEGHEDLVKARVLLEHGEYEASLREAQALLEAHPRTMGDEALLLKGLIYAHPDNPYKDYRISLEHFERLKQEFPERYTVQLADLLTLFVSDAAKKDDRNGKLKEKTAVLERAIEKEHTKQKKLEQETERLREETRTLKDQLVKLKEIDLVIEQKKHELQ